MNEARSTKHETTRNTAPTMPDDVVLSVRGVSKKFCRNLRRSMWYGIQDLSRNLIGRSSAAPGSSFLVPRSSLTKNHELGAMNTPQAYQERSTKHEARRTKNEARSTNNEARITKNEARSTNNEARSTKHEELPPLRRHEFWALQNISFDLKRGECLGLIGRNGCGKTTLLRLIAGIFPPDHGEIAIRGRTGALIALGAGFHPHMTGRENVYLNGAILGLRRWEIEDRLEEIVAFSEVGEFIDAPVATYSSGMKVRLGFAVAVNMRPDLLLVDEVLAVGDVGFRNKCYNKIYEMMQNAAVIFVSHNVPQIAKVCNCGLMLKQGHPYLLTNSVEDVIDAYHSEFEGERLHVSGSGKAVLTELYAQPGEARPQLVYAPKDKGTDASIFVRHGERFALRGRVTLDRNYKQLILGIMIADMEGKTVAQCTSINMNKVYEVDASGDLNFEITIPKMMLNKGKYSLHLVMFSGSDLAIRGEVLADYRNVASLHVSADSVRYGAGAVQLIAEWKND